jgi:outer membrane biosynthesis protein TonB
MVSAVINERGKPESPSLPGETDPVLALAAFEAVRTWTFEPARQGGRPVAVFFVLTVNFKVQRCG